MIGFKSMDRQSEWDWFKERTHVLMCEDTQGIVAVDDRQGIAAMAVFDTWTPVAVNVHLALGNPMAIRRGLFTEIAVHAYHRCGRERMFGVVPSNNARAIRLNAKIGFRIVGRVEDTLDDGVDTVIMRLDKADCRWMPQELREVA